MPSAVVILNETLAIAIFNKQILVSVADKGEDANMASACLVEVC